MLIEDFLKRTLIIIEVPPLEATQAPDDPDHARVLPVLAQDVTEDLALDLAVDLLFAVNNLYRKMWRPLSHTSRFHVARSLVHDQDPDPDLALFHAQDHHVQDLLHVPDLLLPTEAREDRKISPLFPKDVIHVVNIPFIRFTSLYKSASPFDFCYNPPREKKSANVVYVDGSPSSVFELLAQWTAAT